MKWVNTFGTGRQKRQADITLLFQYIFHMTKEVALTWLDIDMALTNIGWLNTGSCISSNIMLKILVEYFNKHCRPRWDATVLKSRTIHIDIICFCLFDLMLYVPCQQFLSHAGMISCLPGSNQYQAADKVFCSCTHLHSESVGGESPTSSPSIPSLMLSHLSH